MLTLGIDLAAQNEDTAYCEVEWARGRAEVQCPVVGERGESIEWLADALRQAVATGGWVGIDAPLAGRRRWWTPSVDTQPGRAGRRCPKSNCATD